MLTSTINIQIPSVWKSALYPVCCSLTVNGDMLFMDVCLIYHYLPLWRFTCQQYYLCIHFIKHLFAGQAAAHRKARKEIPLSFRALFCSIYIY